MIDWRYYSGTPGSARHVRRRLQRRAMGCAYTHKAAADKHYWLTIIQRHA